jgi:beta-galactosidase
MWECKKVFQPIEVEVRDWDRMEFSVINRHAFLKLSEFTGDWQVLLDGLPVAQGLLPSLDTPPAESEVFTLPLGQESLAPLRPPAESSKEFVLRTRFRLRHPTPWADAGYEIAWNEFVPPWNKTVKAEPPDNLPAVELAPSDSETIVQSSRFEAKFDKQRGNLVSWKVDGEPLLTAPLVANFWRALTDNDMLGGRVLNPVQMPWKNAFADAELTNFETTRVAADSATVTADYALAGVDAKLTLKYTLRGDGQLTVSGHLKRGPKTPRLPRVGVQMGIPRELATVAYYGRGPHENYWDRKSGSALGQYQHDVDSVGYDYVRPQENGNRSDCRWVEFRARNGRRLHITGTPHFAFSAWPYSFETLQKARHTTDLTPAGYTTVNLDHRQMGVGGDNSWSPKALPLPPYQLTHDEYRFQFVLQPQP